MNTDIIEKLKKIKEVALRGVPGGEKEAAQKLLDKLMCKYDISLTELEDEENSNFVFEYHGQYQYKLLIQIIYKVTNKTDTCYPLRYKATGYKCKTKLGVYCTPSQAVEIRVLFDFYVALWKKEIKTLLDAFIIKHDLFGELKEGAKEFEWSDEEEQKVNAFINGLSDDSPHKRIEANASATETE
jgi:hypothetical protein